MADDSGNSSLRQLRGCDLARGDGCQYEWQSGCRGSQLICIFDQGCTAMQVAAQYCCVKTCRSRAAGVDGIHQAGETNGLVTKSRQYFLVTQQSVAIVFEHQHRLAGAAARRLVRFIGGGCFNARRAGQPDVKLRAGARSAADFEGAAVLQDDFAVRGEPETIASNA